MSFISVDLKVIEVTAPAVARAAGVGEDRILAGLVRLWHRCWSTKSDHLEEIELAGVFGGDRIGEIRTALVAFGLLEGVNSGPLRVRGAARYLRIQAGRSAGGKASVGNLKRGSGPPADPRHPPGIPPAASRLVPGLSPITDHRSPITDTKEDLSPKRPATPSDPRLHPLKLVLVADYFAVRGEAYKHGGARDTQALKSLIPIASDENIRERWCSALRRTSYPLVSTFAQLAQKWPDLSAPTSTSKGPVDAGTQSHSHTGWVENF